jgi:hypothetical protein
VWCATQRSGSCFRYQPSQQGRDLGVTRAAVSPVLRITDHLDTRCRYCAWAPPLFINKSTTATAQTACQLILTWVWTVGYYVDINFRLKIIKLFCASLSTPHCSYSLLSVYDHVDGVRRCLWTATSNGLISMENHREIAELGGKTAVTVPHGLTRVRSRASAVRGQRLTPEPRHGLS